MCTHTTCTHDIHTCTGATYIHTFTRIPMHVPVPSVTEGSFLAWNVSLNVSHVDQEKYWFHC